MQCVLNFQGGPYLFFFNLNSISTEVNLNFTSQYLFNLQMVIVLHTQFSLFQNLLLQNCIDQLNT